MAASTIPSRHRADRAPPLRTTVYRNPEHYKLSRDQRLAIKKALPARALQVATVCRALGVSTRLRVRMKDSNGEIFEANLAHNMVNLIHSYESWNERDLLGYAQQYHFSSYRRHRRLTEPRYGETAAEREERERRDSLSAKELERYTKRAAIAKPDVQNAKGNLMKWALALEYPEHRDNRANEVRREGPIAMLRNMMYDIEKAGEVLRHAPGNKHVPWLVAQCTKSLVVPEKAAFWLKKAVRHHELYKELLAEWVEENGRQLNIHAVLYNLYYNPYQATADDYLFTMDHGRGNAIDAAAQFNHHHMIYVRDKAKRGWAKLRYWTLLHYPNRLSKIAWYWRELGAQHSCRPANPATGFAGGRYYLEMLQAGAELEDLAPPPEASIYDFGDMDAHAEAAEPTFPLPALAEKAEAVAQRGAARREGPESGMDTDFDNELDKRRQDIDAIKRKVAALAPLVPLSRQATDSQADSQAESGDESAAAAKRPRA